MRILHLGKYYPPARGGIESHVQVLARAQAAAGHAVEVLCFNHEDVRGAPAFGRTVARVVTREDTDGPVRVRRLGRALQLARTDLSPPLLAEVLRGRLEATDVVHLHTPNPAMLAACALARPRRLVVTHHSDIVKQRRLARIHGPVEEHVYGRANRVLATSEAYARASEVLGRHRARVSVVPLGIDLSVFEEVEREAETGAEPLWLFVGRLVYYKGLKVALEALQGLPGRLVVVGDGPLRQELESRAEALGVAERVAWRRDVSEAELRSLYARATALWLPSVARSEAFGLVQVEAMASGCPVLNTDIPGSGVPWVSLDGASGRTVPVDDAAAFRAAARELLEPDVRTRLGEGARARARALFGAETMARATLAAYAEAC